MSTNTEDESFHPLGEEWESQLTDMLDDTEYDTELGLAMAEDAQRLVAGELTEAEFHAKYHDRVLEEFGEDERPTAGAYEEMQEAERGGFLDALSSFDGDSDQSRRDVMKKMGAGGAFLGFAALASSESDPSFSAADEHDDESDTQWGMTIDLEVCDGCLSCVTACSEENNLDQGVNWMYVLAYEDDTVQVPEDPSVRDYPYLVRPCQHCSDAPCEKVCPTTARHTRNKDGLVLTDYDVCIGCRYCQVACPYGVNYFQWDEPDVSQEAIADHMSENLGEDIGVGDEGDHIHADYDGNMRPVDSRAPRGVMSKCTFCPTRQDGFNGDDKVGTTACQQACPPGAIQFGNVNDPTSDPSIYAQYPALARALKADVYGDTPEPETLEESIQAHLDDADEDDLDFDLLVEFLEDDEDEDEDDEDDDEEEEEDAEDEDEEEDELPEIDLDVDQLRILRAIDIVTADFDIDPDTEKERALIRQIGRVRDLVAVLEDLGIDFDDEDVRLQLRLGDGEADDALTQIRADHGSPESTFKLLEDIGTNPNVTYLGNEPGPRAEQVPGPVSYDLTYNRADGSSPSLVDDRKDVLDESTLGGM